MWQSLIIHKNFGSSTKYENVVKMALFRLFLENGSNDFDQTRSEGRTNQYRAPPENCMSKKIAVLEIFIHKVEILAKNAKSGVQRSRYISRTVNATENLIWYSESTINFLSCTSHQIFTYLSSSWRKFDSKTANFHAFFGWFFGIFSPTTWNILTKLGQKWDKMDTKQTQKTRDLHIKPFWRFLGSK